MPQNYTVLARKYRPKTFDDMIGQEVLVTTLSNAIQSNRIAHAFVLTGIRGIGKTTTARIIARALNCIGIDGQSGPTITPCGQCTHCIAIEQDRHPDILEMDAASRTGVEDIREIIENTKYVPVSARYKIFIIDEVHMLSRNAFNALLKTLEEPPPHIKFIFATTEIRKIPITILSRCQRFDLRRVEENELANHLERIIGKENIDADPEALGFLAHAAEGSVRDALSLLDQAIVHGNGSVTTSAVQAMMGLSSEDAILAIITACAEGKTAEALSVFRDLYRNGADPFQILQDLMECIYTLSSLAIQKSTQESPHATLARDLDIGYLSRAWQILLRGLQEVRMAPDPVMATEMVLIRLAHLSDLPPPEEWLKQSTSEKAREIKPQSPTTPSHAHTHSALFSEPHTAQKIPANTGYSSANHNIAPKTTAPEISRPPEATNASPELLERFRELVELFRTHQEFMLYHQLQSDMHVVELEGEILTLHAKPTVASKDLTQRLSDALSEWTGKSWSVRLSAEFSAPTLKAYAEKKAQNRIDEATTHPDIKSALDTFPGAKVISVHQE